MQITLDRNLCSRTPILCELCFADHLRKSNFEAAECAITINHNSRPEVCFKIYDRDDSIKTMVVTDENRVEVFNSWMTAWEQQAGPII